tara:strand:- start:365 stop:841 length:477 start_codon:yes stop_codon:yes gene_type:complete
MVLAWLSNIWKSQKVDPQLFKFTKQFTYESNIENINTFFSKLSNYSYAKEAVNRVNQQRAFDLSFIDSEIKNLESITIPTPKFISYQRVGRKPQPWETVTGRYSNRRWWIENPEKKRIYQQQVQQFDIYKSDTLSRIADNISFLGKQRDLIPSEPFSL